ncbi:MAG TPA: hypothetical protein VGH13_07330 [Xanthobacteraceae bacterium]
MQLPRNTKRNYVARGTMILFAALTLSAAVATDALAAGHGGGRIGGGAHGGGHMGRGFRGPLVDSIPAAPGPTFNPSTPYTVPQAGETPVSPGSPGSVFGDR